MKIDSFLDYPTLLANQGRPVHLAIRLEAASSSGKRPQPAAFCLVLDRSGSMAGDPLAHAKSSAALAVRNLRREDHFAVVTFDTEARTVIPLQPADAARKPAFLDAIGGIRDGGSTNLTAGWMLGRDALRDAPAGSRRRLLLLSDGHLNVGITDSAAVRQIVASGLERDGIRTACLGFGSNYDKNLLADLARATQGEFHDASSPDKFPAIFASELEGLQKISVQNLRLRLRRLDFCDALDALGDYPEITLPDGRVEFSLGDLVADEQRVVCFGLRALPIPLIDGQPAFSLEGEPLLELELFYDKIDGEGIVSRSFRQVIRVRATQDPGEVRPNGEVIQWVALQRAGIVVERVARHMGARELDAAMALIDRTLAEIGPSESGPGVADAVRQLQRMRAQIVQGEWNLRSSKMAMYRSKSNRRMSSATPWTLDDEAPFYKAKPPQPPVDPSLPDPKP